MELVIALVLAFLLFLLIGAIQGFRAAAQLSPLRRRIAELEARINAPRIPQEPEAPPPLPLPDAESMWPPFQETRGQFHEEAERSLPWGRAQRPADVLEPALTAWPVSSPRAAIEPNAPPQPIASPPQPEVIGAPAHHDRTPARLPHKDLQQMERAVGLRGMTFVGIAMLFLGVAFFLKYAYDQDWLGRLLTPPMRIALASLVTLGVGLAGWRSLRSGMLALGQGLLGGAQALSYLVICAALEPSLLLAPTPLISQSTAVLSVALATGFGLWTAVRLNAYPMALLALVGGMIAPWLIVGHDIHHAYLFALDLGVLAAVLHRRWPALDAIAFVGSMSYFAHIAFDHTLSWSPEPTETAPSPEAWWLLAYHVVFALLPLTRAIRHQSPLGAFQVALATANAALSYWFAVLIFWEQEGLGISCLGASALHVGLAALVARKAWRNLAKVQLHLAIGTAFLSVSAFHFLPVEAVGGAWFLQAILLVGLGPCLGLAKPALRRVALAVLMSAVVHTLVLPLSAWDKTLRLGWNPWLGQLFVQSAGLAAFAWVHHRTADGQARSPLALPLAILAGWWTLFIFGLEVHRHASGHPASWDALSPLAVIAAIQLVGAVAFAGLGAWRRSHWIYAAAFPALFAAGVLIALAYGHYPADAALLRNATFFTGLAAILLLIGMQRMARRLPDSSAVRSALGGAAQLLLLGLLTTEVIAWKQRGPLNPSSAEISGWLGWLWLGFACSGGFMAALTKQRLILWLSAIPLSLSLCVAFWLYATPIDPHPLLTSARWSFALGATAAVASAGLALRSFGMLRSADRAGPSALLLVLMFGTLEAYTWNHTLAQDPGAPPWALWLFALLMLLASALGGLRAKAAHNASLTSVALFAALPMLGAALSTYFWSWPSEFMILNPRFLLVAAAIGVASAWAARGRGLLGWLTFTAGLVAITAEAPLWILDQVTTTLAAQAEADRQALFAVTVSWLSAAIPLLVLGFKLQSRQLRWMALLLFGATAAKVLLIDMRDAQEIYRILAFILVGFVLLAASYLYHRVARRLAAS